MPRQIFTFLTKGGTVLVDLNYKFGTSKKPLAGTTDGDSVRIISCLSFAFYFLGGTAFAFGTVVVISKMKVVWLEQIR